MDDKDEVVQMNGVHFVFTTHPLKRCLSLPLNLFFYHPELMVTLHVRAPLLRRPRECRKPTN